RLLQIGRVKTLGEPAVDWGEEFAGRRPGRGATEQGSRALQYSSSATSGCPCWSSSWPLSRFSSAANQRSPLLSMSCKASFNTLKPSPITLKPSPICPATSCAAAKRARRIRHPCLRPDSAVSAQAAAQERYSLCHIPIFDHDPAAIDGS